MLVRTFRSKGQSVLIREGVYRVLGRMKQPLELTSRLELSRWVSVRGGSISIVRSLDILPNTNPQHLYVGI